MEWECKGDLEVDKEVWVSDKDIIDGVQGSDGRPTGMGGRNTIKRTMLFEEATHLIELNVDKITKR